MRRAFFIILMCIYCDMSMCYGQSAKTVDIISSFVSKMRSIPSLEMQFRVSSRGKGSDANYYIGTIQSQDMSYRLMNPLIEIFCDGKTKWILNVEKKELVIAHNDVSNFDLIENPLGFFINMDKGYLYDEMAEAVVVNKKRAWAIRLAPKKRRLPYRSIVINIDRVSFEPLSVEYFAKDGAVYLTEILYFLAKERWPKENFVFPVIEQKGLTVTDLR